MTFTFDVFIKRPVLATVLLSVLLVLGLKAFLPLQVQYPEIRKPALLRFTNKATVGASVSSNSVITQLLQAEIIAQTAVLITWHRIVPWVSPWLPCIEAGLSVGRCVDWNSVSGTASEVQASSSGVLDPSIPSRHRNHRSYMSHFLEWHVENWTGVRLRKPSCETDPTVEGVSKLPIYFRSRRLCDAYLAETSKACSYGRIATDVQNALRSK